MHLTYHGYGLDHFLALVFAVKNEDRIAEFNGLAVVAGPEVECDGTEFFADVLTFDPAPITTTAAHVVLTVFACEIAEVSRRQRVR